MLLYHDCYYLSHSKHEQANEARKITPSYCTWYYIEYQIDPFPSKPRHLRWSSGVKVHINLSTSSLVFWSLLI